MMTAGVLVLAGLAWVAITGLMARGELGEVRDGVAKLRHDVSSGDLRSAAHDLTALATHARRAHDLTTGPAWALGAALPAGGEPMRTVRGLAAAADRLAHGALPELVAARGRLDPATLRSADGTVDLGRVAAAAPGIHRAAVQLAATERMLRGLPASTWLAPVDAARGSLLRSLRGIDGTVRSADAAARVLPPLLGQNGPRRYFVAFQNEAEARGTGGLPGSFGILAAEHGKMTFERFESDSFLDGAHTDVRLGADFDALYGPADATGLFVNSNLSPNFPYAARIWTSMWEQRTGQQLDGAVGLDPTALSYLLDATGSTTLPDGTALNGGNVVSLTESAVYERFDGRTTARRQYLVQVARAAASTIINFRGSSIGLVRAATRAVGERRLLVWSDDPVVQDVLGSTEVGGVVPSGATPYAGLSIVNDGGDKLDYYLDRDVTWTRTGCGPSRRVTVSIRLTNSAPAGLPVSVTARSDVRGYRIRPGDNRLQVAWFATSGGELDAATLNGRAIGAQVGAERGHPVFTFDVELPRGATRTLMLTLREPGRGAAAGRPEVLRQPLVRPLTVHVQDARCG